MLEKIISAVLGLGDKLGAFVIPVAIAAVVLLALFARYSYKCFRFALPVLAGVAAAFIAFSAVRDLVTGSSISDLINIEYVAGAVVGLAIAGICVKLHGLAMLLLGAGVGYVALGGLVRETLLGVDYIYGLAVAAGSTVSTIIGVAISLICLAVCAFIFKKLFKAIYVLVTSIGGMAAACGIAAVFIFANTSIAELTLLVALVIGAVVGLILSVKQLKVVVEDLDED